MKSLINNYNKVSEEAFSRNQQLATEKTGLINLIISKNIKEYKHAISAQYDKLKLLDNDYYNYFTTQGTINDLKLLNNQLDMVARSRDIAITSLVNFEKSIVAHDNNLNFKLTTIIAITALLFSIFI